MNNFFKKGSFFGFKKATAKTDASFYNYKSHDPLRQAEADLTKKFSFLFILIIVLSLVLYLWGVPMVATIGSFWQSINPSLGSGILQNDNEVLIAPRVDTMPSQINDFSKLKVSGWSMVGYKVQIFVNDKDQIDVPTDSSGHFEATGLTLNDGQNTIFAQITKGKTLAKSSTQQIIFSKTPPKLEVYEPSDGQEIIDPAQNWFIVSGKSSPNITVTVNDHQAILDTNGNFKYQYLLGFGNNRLAIKAVDEAGNQSLIERTVRFNPTLTVTPSP